MKQPILAICYDFDKTLSPDDMQAQGYIQSIDYEIAEFWKQSNQLASDNDMDQNLAYMYMMASKSRGKVLFTKETLHKDGGKVQLFPGVETWFDRVNEYGKRNGVIVEHYIISSGLKEMIEGTKVATKFKKIYASSFYFDEDGVAVWPAQVVNYTNKTQFLFRIEKGVLDINDQAVNSHFEPNQYRVPFRNMVYIGDSDTDIPCMKLVNINGGHSIGVYNSETKDKTKVFRMLDENRIKYFAPADYTEGSKLEHLVQQIIDRTITNEILEDVHFDCIAEKLDETRGQSEEELKKEELIDKLEDSSNFANTHSIIEQMLEIKEWSEDQKCKLFKIALENNQVTYILKDVDVKDFYRMICKNNNSEEAKRIKEILATLRKDAPTQIGGTKVVRSEDYKECTIKEGDTVTELTGFTKSDVLKYYLEDGSWIAVRPSGTEPKCKFYYCIKGASKEDAHNKTVHFQKAMDDLIAK